MNAYSSLDQINPPVPGTLAVWHRQKNNGDKTFYVTVRSAEQALEMIKILNLYDQCMIPNPQVGTSGLMIFKDQLWKEWFHDTGFDIHEWRPGKVR